MDFKNMNEKDQLEMFESLLPNRYINQKLQFKEFFKSLDLKEKSYILMSIKQNENYFLEYDRLYILWEDKYLSTDVETDSDNEDYEYETTNLYSTNGKLIDFNQIHRKKIKPSTIKPYEDNNSLFRNITNVKCTCGLSVNTNDLEDHKKSSYHNDLINKKNIEKELQMKYKFYFDKKIELENLKESKVEDIHNYNIMMKQLENEVNKYYNDFETLQSYFNNTYKK